MLAFLVRLSKFKNMGNDMFIYAWQVNEHPWIVIQVRGLSKWEINLWFNCGSSISTLGLIVKNDYDWMKNWKLRFVFVW